MTRAQDRRRRGERRQDRERLDRRRATSPAQSAPGADDAERLRGRWRRPAARASRSARHAATPADAGLPWAPSRLVRASASPTPRSDRDVRLHLHLDHRAGLGVLGRRRQPAPASPSSSPTRPRSLARSSTQSADDADADGSRDEFDARGAERSVLIQGQVTNYAKNGTLAGWRRHLRRRRRLPVRSLDQPADRAVRRPRPGQAVREMAETATKSKRKKGAKVDRKEYFDGRRRPGPRPRWSAFWKPGGTGYDPTAWSTRACRRHLQRIVQQPVSGLPRLAVRGRSTWSPTARRRPSAGATTHLQRARPVRGADRTAPGSRSRGSTCSTICEALIVENRAYTNGTRDGAAAGRDAPARVGRRDGDDSAPSTPDSRDPGAIRKLRERAERPHGPLARAAYLSAASPPYRARGGLRASTTARSSSAGAGAASRFS